jgi:2-C-methyl-D-erythritol 2,4-cyclodiphosphate synthase
MKSRRHVLLQALYQPVIRVGFGYDIHRFAPKRKLLLGGVRIPSRVGLLGHSDADVLLHAICDALLGAASLGDIGTHFPDTSSKLKNISSLKLLERVQKLLRQEGYDIVNIDATVVLERPKLMPYVPKMVRRIARRLRLLPAQVSVKATTNEGLESLGRAEACAAFAVATIQRRGIE